MEVVKVWNIRTCISNCTITDASQQNSVFILNMMLNERQDDSFQAVTEVWICICSSSLICSCRIQRKHQLVKDC